MYSFLIAILILSNSYAKEPFVFAQMEGLLDQAIGAKILKVAYKKANIDVSFQELPSRRCLVESNSGRLAGEVHRIYSIGSKYKNLIRVPTPINYIEPTFFSRKLIELNGDCKNISKNSIIINRGTIYAERCAKNAKSVIYRNNSESVLSLLELSRADLGITAKLNGLDYLKKTNSSNIKLLKPSLKRLYLYHYIHKDFKFLIPKIDKVLQKMKKSGELKKLRQSLIFEMLEK